MNLNYINNKLAKRYVLERKVYGFDLVSAFIAMLIISFGYIVAITPFKPVDRVLYYIISSLIFTFFLYFNKFNGFKSSSEFSISGYLVYSGEERFSLYVFRLIGIWLASILGIIVLAFLFYISGLWKVGRTPGTFALNIASSVLRSLNQPFISYFISSIIFGIFLGFIYFFIFFDNNNFHVFIALFLFSLIVLSGSFMYYQIESIRYILAIFFKKSLIEVSSRYEVVKFTDLGLRLLVVSFGNFLGNFLITLPLLRLFYKTKDIEIKDE